MKQTTSGWGGARPGAGKKTLYPGKPNRRTYAMALTADGRARLDRLAKRSGLYRTDLMEHLIRAYGDQVAFRTAGVVYPGKVYPPVAVRLTAEAGRILQDAARRSGKSWSDIGEALIRRATRLRLPEAPYGKDAHQAAR